MTTNALRRPLSSEKAPAAKRAPLTERCGLCSTRVRNQCSLELIDNTRARARESESESSQRERWQRRRRTADGRTSETGQREVPFLSSGMPDNLSTSRLLPPAVLVHAPPLSLSSLLLPARWRGVQGAECMVSRGGGWLWAGLELCIPGCVCVCAGPYAARPPGGLDARCPFWRHVTPMFQINASVWRSAVGRGPCMLLSLFLVFPHFRASSRLPPCLLVCALTGPPNACILVR